MHTIRALDIISTARLQYTYYLFITACLYMRSENKRTYLDNIYVTRVFYELNNNNLAVNTRDSPA